MDGQQPLKSDEPVWQFKPGETVRPHQMDENQPPQPQAPQGVAASQPAVSVQAATSQQPTEQPSATLPPEPVAMRVPPQPVAQQSQPMVANAVAAPPVLSPQQGQSDASSSDSISWTASEFVSRQKSGNWYVIVVIAFLVLAVGVWIIFRDIVSTFVTAFAGVALSYYGSRKPSQIQYKLGYEGLTIGNRQLAFGDFRAFSVVPDGAFETVQLLPVKRFAPMTTLFFDPKDGDKIIDIIGAHLPHQERGEDAIDSLMRRIRF